MESVTNSADDRKEIRVKKKSAWDKIRTLAEILGMSSVQTMSLFLDLVKILGSGLWEAGTGWIDGYNWEEWLYEYVPNHVHDATLLAVFTLLSMDKVSSTNIASHYQDNLVGWETYSNKYPGDVYIEHQGDMEDILYYGNHTADYNACEVIAVYNVLVAMNDGTSPTSFPELLANFEGNGIVLGGEFGTDPTALYLYLDSNGYDVDMLYGESVKDSKLERMQSDYDTYILTAYNDADNLGEMIHTVSITTENIDGQVKYVIHNAGDSTQYDSLAEAVNGYNDGTGEPISVIGVK